MMWYPQKAAFRVGAADDGSLFGLAVYPVEKAWDRDSIGLFSFATGYNCKAIRDYSFASGFQTTARAVRSMAIGNETFAEGENSSSGGEFAIARGWNSFSFGSRTKAFGTNSIALGSLAEASGENAVAIGSGTVANNLYSHSFGYRTASTGRYAFAMGSNARVEGDYSFALGNFSFCNSSYSFAVGAGSTVLADSSFAFGIGASTLPAAANGVAIGHQSLSNGRNGIAIGSLSYAFGENAVAVGTSSKAFTDAVAFGIGARSEGIGTFSGGYFARADGAYSTAIGYRTYAKEPYSIALGNETVAEALFSFAAGDNTTARSVGCTSIGRFNDNSDPLSMGYNPVDRIFQIGNGHLFGRSNALTLLRNGFLGLGTVAPVATIDVIGNMKITDGTEGAGKVLTSDASGLANWQDLPVANAYWASNSNDIYNNNTGNVGIGTSTPNSPLSFANTLGNKISLWGSSSASNYGVGVQGSLLQLYVPGTTDNIGFGTGSSNSFTERMRIQGNGNVGIGNTDPAFPLDISNRMRIRSGGSNASTAGIWLNNNANSALTGFVGMESDNAIGFYGTGTPNGWGVVMDIATGNVGIGTSIPSQKLHVIGNILATGTITPSDIRYKTNIHPIQNSLHKLVALNGVTYLMNRVAHPEWQFDSTMQYGLIAQEVEKIFPEIVSTISADGYKGIDYVKLVPVLIEGVKELEAKNSFLENENCDIKKRLEQLEAKLNLLLQNSTIAKQ